MQGADTKTPSAGVGKLAFILTICFFAECVADNSGFVYHRRGRITKGSCLSYGHACWGAHGKRGGGGHVEYPEEPPSKEEPRANLFLSKLVSPLDLLYYRGAWDKSFKRDDVPEELARDVDKDVAKTEQADVDAFFDGAARGDKTIEDIFKNAKFMEKQGSSRHV